MDTKKSMTVPLDFIAAIYALSYTVPPVCTPLRSRWPETSAATDDLLFTSLYLHMFITTRSGENQP